MNNIGKQGQPREQKKKREVEAPVCLGDLFAENDEEKEDECFNQLYEVQDLDIGGSVFKVRQFAWHGANANKVWPGTFNLAEFICLNKDRYGHSPILELGAATGALSVYLSSNPLLFDMCTSDIDDGGEVQENILHNFELNNLPSVLHIPHTWGTGWNDSSLVAIMKSDKLDVIPAFKFIFASDILLYVSAYPALVKTLCEIFEINKFSSLDSDSNLTNLEEFTEDDIMIADCFIEEDYDNNYDNSNNNEYRRNSDMGEGREEGGKDENDDEDDSLLVADLIAVGVIAGSDMEADIEESEYDKKNSSNNCNINDINNNCNNKNEIDDNYYNNNHNNIPSAMAVVVTSKNKSKNKGKDKLRNKRCDIGKDGSDSMEEEKRMERTIESVNHNNMTKYSLHSGKKENQDNSKKENKVVYDIVAVAIAVEFIDNNNDDDSDILESANFSKSDLILETDPEPVILEAETVHSAPRTFSSNRNCVLTEENYKSIDKNVVIENVDGKIELVKKKGEAEEVVNNNARHRGPPVEFLMSWNRRIAESSIFFELMKEAGFTCEHKGKCVYSFIVLKNV